MPRWIQAPSKFNIPRWLFVILLSFSCFSAEAAPPTAIVPYNPDQPLSQQTPNQIYLDYATFQRLWDAAKETRRDRSESEDQTETPREIAGAETGIDSPDTTLTSSLYKAVARGDSLSVTARLSLLARGKGVREFPLPFGTAAIDKITLDDAPAAYREGKIILPGAGHHTVTVHFDLPLKKGWRAAEWTIPQAAASALSLSIPESYGDPTVNGGLPLVQKSPAEPERKTPAGPESEIEYTAALGSATKVTLALTSRTRAHALAEPSLADIAARLFVTPALDRLEVDFDFTFTGGEQDKFSFSFPSDVTPVGVSVPDLKSWTLRDGDTPDTKTLEFTLASPAKDRLQVGFTGERAASKIPGTATFPALTAGAARTTRKLALLTVPEVKLIPRPPPAFRQVPLDTDTAGTGFRFIGAFETATSGTSFPFDLTPGSLDKSAKAEFVFQVGRGKVETFAGFQLRSPESDLHTTIFDLPPDTAIESVLGNRIADWWRDGDALYLRFSGETPEVTTALIYLSRSLDEDAEASVVTRPPIPRDFKETTGTGILAAHAASDTLLRFDKPVTAVREIAPAGAAREFDFAIVPPFERKRAFSFQDADFTATVTLSRLEPRFDVIWTLRTDVHETWTGVSSFVDIEVKRSALTQTTFTLPADIPEARVTGSQIREITHEVNGDLREYTVSFQNDVTDQVRFEIATETNHSGESPVPSLTFPQANRAEGFVIVDNYSKDRMAVTAKDAAVATQNQLPYTPDYLISASVYRVRPGYSITAKLEELETTAGSRALALYAEHTTALRKNGEVWTRATYRLQNRSLQFLPIRIPPGSTVIAARVAGSNVRIDKAAGAPADQILIPLIQTQPGQIAYDVELVLRRPGNDGASATELTQMLEDPELVGVPVERTTWRVFLPEGFRIEDSDGNMTEVTTVELEQARAETQLKELKKKVSNTRSEKNTELDRSANWHTANQDLDSLQTYIDANKPIGGVEVEELDRQVQAQRRLLEDQRQNENRPAQDQSRLGTPNGWNYNPSALGDRQDQIDQKRAQYYDGIENKLGLNDNVILGNRDILTKPQDEPQELADPSGKPGKESPQQKGQKGGEGRSSQLDRLESNGRAAGEKGKSEELFRNQSDSFEKDARSRDFKGNEPPQIPQNIGTPQPPAKKPQRYGEEQQSQTLDQGFTNNARFLNQKAEQQKSKEAPPAGQMEQPNAPGIPVAPTTPPAGGQRDSGSEQAAEPQSGPVSDSRNSNAIQSSRYLQQEGRISLAVDFPTHGQPLVFSKLKAHANLTITAGMPTPSSGRLTALLTLAIALAILFAADHLLGFRRRRTAS